MDKILGDHLAIFRPVMNDVHILISIFCLDLDKPFHKILKLCSVGSIQQKLKHFKIVVNIIAKREAI